MASASCGPGADHHKMLWCRAKNALIFCGERARGESRGVNPDFGLGNSDCGMKKANPDWGIEDCGMEKAGRVVAGTRATRPSLRSAGWIEAAGTAPQCVWRD